MGERARGALLGLALGAAASAHTWVQGPPAPMDGLWGRYRAAMAYDSLHAVVVLFGGTDDQNYASDTWEFDGTTWRMGPRPAPGMRGRASHGMAYDSGRRRIVVFGGFDAAGEMNDTWECDGSVWTVGATAPVGLRPRRAYTMSYDSWRGRCVIFGGYTGMGYLNDTWEYDGQTWTAGPPAPKGLKHRALHAMAFDAVRGRTVLFGGIWGETFGPAFGDTWEYDGSQWLPGPSMPPQMRPRGGHGMVFDAMRGRIVVFGGEDPKGVGLLSDTWEYDGAAWTIGASAPASLTPRLLHAMAYDGSLGRSVAFGGYGDWDESGDDTWTYDGAVWSSGPDAPPALTPRAQHAMAYDTWRGRVVLYGGYSGVANFIPDDTWEFDGTAWRVGPQAPPALGGRAGHAMAFDSGRGRVMLVGGARDPDAFNDTWEYDGSSWVQGPSVGTFGRTLPSLAYDSDRRRTVLFGGLSWASGNPTNDTWEYDGSSWSLGATAPAGLTIRESASMAYDPARRRVVLFGGATNAYPYLYDDTWEYDGAAWLLGPTAPPDLTPRQGQGMAFDAVLGRVVMVGGTGWPCWEYDGTGWTPGNDVPTVATDRVNIGIAYDERRGRVVVFGGLTGSSPIKYNDTWEYAPGTPNYLIGAGLGEPNPNRVRLLDSGGSPTPTDFLAYGAGHWGTNVASADVDLGSTDEILTGPGPGAVYGPNVRGFRADGSAMGKIAFYAYGTLKYGVKVGAGAIDADPYGEILTGAGPGSVFGPHVRAWNFDATAISPIGKVSFYAYTTLEYGVNVVSGNIDGDAFAELLTAPGPGAAFAPHVRGFNYDASTLTGIGKINFWAFTTLAYGANVAAGDADADAFDEIECAPGPGQGSAFPAQFRGFDYDGASIVQAPGFDVVAFPTTYGGRLGSGSMDGEPRDELLAAAGRDPAADSTVRPFIYSGSTLIPYPPSFVAMPGTSYGVNEASGRYGF